VEPFVRQAAIVGAASALLVGLAGCAKHKENAIEALAKVDAACAQQDQDTAREVLRTEAANNPVFREAYEASRANWTVSDDSKVNPCGIFLADLKKRLGGH
jgi:hypothetical protein